MDFTNYIALDLEWNQPPCADAVKTKNGVDLHGEIIQIGAVKMNNKFKITDTFKTDVKPEAYKKIAKRVEKMTGINTDIARKGMAFSDAVESFAKWCGEDFTFLTWGNDDIKILHDNLSFCGIYQEWMPSKNYDLQMIFDYLTQKKGRQFSLDFAIEYYNIKATETRHNAFNDAYYTALVCEKMKPFKCIDNYRKVIIEKIIHQHEASDSDEFIRRVRVLESLNPVRSFNVMCTEQIRCPECNRKASLMKKYHKGTLNYALMYSCRVHGDFISLLKLKPVENFNFTKVVRNTYRPGNSENMKIGLKTKKWRAV